MTARVILAILAMLSPLATPAEISRADEFLAALAAVESGRGRARTLPGTRPLF